MSIVKSGFFKGAYKRTGRNTIHKHTYLEFQFADDKIVAFTHSDTESGFSKYYDVYIAEFRSENLILEYEISDSKEEAERKIIEKLSSYILKPYFSDTQEGE